MDKWLQRQIDRAEESVKTHTQEYRGKLDSKGKYTCEEKKIPRANQRFDYKFHTDSNGVKKP